jgi:hypothetical protein
MFADFTKKTNEVGWVAPRRGAEVEGWDPSLFLLLMRHAHGALPPSGRKRKLRAAPRHLPPPSRTTPPQAAASLEKERGLRNEARRASAAYLEEINRLRADVQRVS